MATYSTADQVQRRNDALLTDRARSVATTIDRRIDAYVEKVYGLRGMFEAMDGRPTRRQFAEYLTSQEVRRRLPGAQAIGFAEVTRLADRDAFVDRVERDAAASGLPYPKRLKIRPNAFQPISVAVTYYDPVPKHEEIFGFDLLSEPGRRAAVLRARDEAAVAATAPYRFIIEPADERGVLLTLPLYSGDDQRPPQRERARRLRGIAFAALRLPNLLRDAASPGDDLELYDRGAVGALSSRLRPGDQAFDLRGGPDAPSRDPKRSRLLPIEVAGRSWAVYLRPQDSLVAASERAVPWLVGSLGVIVSLLAGGVVQALASSRRRAEALAAQMTEELRRSNEELERFAFLASHDLQQPLRTVSGFLQLLERQLGGALDERAREYIAHALRGTKQMGTLIDDLLAYSRAGRDDRPLGPVALDDAWDAAVEQLGSTIEQAGATVERGELPVVTGDPGQLVQVFANLIGNAVKYRGDAPPRVRGEARRAGRTWEIAVQDNGIGIDPRHHDKIFEMFRRLHTEEDYEGTGVGLALAKRIVERAGGSIRVESTPGSGSRFVLTLQPAEPRGRGR